jgi:hypothetical protein
MVSGGRKRGRGAGAGARGWSCAFWGLGISLPVRGRSLFGRCAPYWAVLAPRSHRCPALSAGRAPPCALSSLLPSQADLQIPALKIVGYEGAIGAVVMLLLLLPIVQRLPGKDGQGVHEDSTDTWHVSSRRLQGLRLRPPQARMPNAQPAATSRCAAPILPPLLPPFLPALQMITHSRTIAIVLGIDMFALMMYNVAGMCVTGHLGAVFRWVMRSRGRRHACTVPTGASRQQGAAACLPCPHWGL